MYVFIIKIRNFWEFASFLNYILERECLIRRRPARSWIHYVEYIAKAEGVKSNSPAARRRVCGYFDIARARFSNAA